MFYTFELSSKGLYYPDTKISEGIPRKGNCRPTFLMNMDVKKAQ